MEVPIIYKILPERDVYVERKLPEAGIEKVSVGDRVEPFDILATTKVSGGAEAINVCEQLEVESDKLLEVIKVESGQSINRGQILAKKKGPFGLKSKIISAPFSSTISSIDWELGVISLELPKRIEKLAAGVAGKVVDIVEKKAFLVKARATTVRGVWGWGQSCSGSLRIAAQRGESLHANCILPSDGEKILIGGSFLEAEAIKKAQVVGVSGIVVGGMDYSDLDLIRESDVSVMVTEGFGRTLMLDFVFQFLENSNKIYTLLMPDRGNLLVARNIDSSTVGSHPNVFFKNLEKGDLVQIYSDALFGRTGRVVAADFDSARIESEGEVLSVLVRNLGLLAI